MKKLLDLLYVLALVFVWWTISYGLMHLGYGLEKSVDYGEWLTIGLVMFYFVSNYMYKKVFKINK